MSRAIVYGDASQHGGRRGISDAADAVAARLGRWRHATLRRLFGTRPAGRRAVPDTIPYRDTHVTREGAPVLPGISAQTPGTMPRAEDDDATRARSPDFHDRPGSGRFTADRLEHF